MASQITMQRSMHQSIAYIQHLITYFSETQTKSHQFSLTLEIVLQCSDCLCLKHAWKTSVDAYIKAEIGHSNSNYLMHVQCIIHQQASCVSYELEIYPGYCADSKFNHKICCLPAPVPPTFITNRGKSTYISYTTIRWQSKGKLLKMFF